MVIFYFIFLKLSCIVNLVSASLKRHLELKSTREFEVAEMIASEKLKTGKGANQIRVLQRAGATHWSSHFNSVARLTDMFDATSCVLENMVENGLNNNIRGEAKGAEILRICVYFAYDEQSYGVSRHALSSLTVKT